NNGGTTNVSASTLLAKASGGGIGSGDALETIVSNLEASATGGDVGISNNGALTIGGIGADVGVLTTTSGDVSVTTSGQALNVTEAVVAAGTGTVSLTGVGLTNNSSITGPGGITLNAGTGTLTTASGTVDSSSGNGNVVLIADTDIITTDGAGVTPVNAGSGNVTLRQNSDSPVVSIGLAGGAGALQISTNDLDDITAGTIIIGSSQSGTLTIGANITNDDGLSFVSGTGIAL
ncbi:uncharacterized protein METZ01_LOCUS503713, partial [marine metagenome]